MKKLLSIIAAAVLLVVCFSTAACTESKDYVSNDATDLLQEDFGIALKKGDTEMLNAVNTVIDAWLADGTMNKYAEYYEDLANDASTAAPEGLKTEWNLNKNGGTVTMYTESGFAPYEFVLNGNVVGLDVAIMSQVAENLNCNLEIKDVLFDTIVTCVKTDEGKAAGAAGITINEERKQSVDFSNVYSSSTLAIVCEKDAGYNTLASLNGLKIGVQQGTSGDLIASAALTAGGYSYENEDHETINIKISGQVVRYNTYAAALAALNTGKIDVIFMDKVPSLLLLANL